MNIYLNIAPMFIIIAIGWIARATDFIKTEYVDQANSLVYHIAIPALIFNAIAYSDFKTGPDIAVIGIALALIMFAFIVSFVISNVFIERPKRGTFIQSSFHGNLGYIGLAAAYFFWGEKGLAKASIAAGPIMILQNLIAIIILQMYSDNRKNSKNITGIILLKIAANPIILSVTAGIFFSLIDIELPYIIKKTLEMLSDLALPTGLLIIGASLSFKSVKSRINIIFLSTFLKLIILPASAFIIYSVFNIDSASYIPVLILLASPTATLTCIMSKEIGGDSILAAGAVSVSTILSALTLILWMHIAV